MSWQDDILQDFTIQTGDGSVYTVFWKKSSRKSEWNAETFSFIGVRGQLTKKEEALARKFNLEFYFQGADNIFDSQQFDNSLNNKNPLLIKHPLYGNITGHIISITYDNADLNVTRITCEVIETIVGVGLINPDPISSIQLNLIQINTESPNELIESEFTVRDGNEIKEVMEANKRDGLKIINLPEEAVEYTNAFNTAATFINVITATPILTMAQVCNFTSMPAQFASLVQDRITFFEGQFQRFLSAITRRRFPTPVNKQSFEIQAASNIAAMCLAAATPTADEYKTARDVFGVMNRLINVYNSYITTLDSLEVSSGGINEYYTYSPNTYSTLYDCLNTTLANLLIIALNGKQEKTVYTTEDSNAHILAHRYYGTSSDDTNLQYFIDTNNLTYQQLIQIKKGTKIIYYA